MEGYFSKQRLSVTDKIISLDYKLIFLVLLLGIISFFAMYSTEQGNFGYYTENHIYRFFIFFIVFLIISFINIRFWHRSAYAIYFLTLMFLFLN